MVYSIRMGLPEMEELWNRLQTSYRDGTISKNDKAGQQLTGLSQFSPADAPPADNPAGHP